MTSLDDLVHRPRPSAWRDFCNEPCVVIARRLYSRQRRIPAEPLAKPVSVVCVSDTHNRQPTLPDGDILIHAGDLTQAGSFDELQAALSWLGSQPHRHKIVVAGNHDLLLDAGRDSPAGDAEAQRGRLTWGDVIYLNDEQVTVTCSNGRQISVYGSPRTPKHGNWAFQYPRPQDVWSGSIPSHLDILVTHGPPRAHQDLNGLGCSHLLKELWRTRPRLHVFGHVHGGYGSEWLNFDHLQRAYELVIVNKGGVGNLLRLLLEYIRALLMPATEARSRLVNASHIGGLRDEKRRPPFQAFI